MLNMVKPWGSDRRGQGAAWARGVVLLTLLGVLAGCGWGLSGDSGDVGYLGAQSLESYRLGPGDRLKITVFGQPEESGTYEIDNQGILAYPILGRVRVGGVSVPELQDFLTEELDKNFFVNPRVTIEVTNYRPFYIYGEVQRPGSYPYVSGLTVRRAVAIAGGFSRRAQQEPVTVIRESLDGPRTYKAELDIPVFPGDTIEVIRRLF